MLEFTDQQKQWRDSVRKFVSEEVSPLARQIDQEARIPDELRWKMAKQGYFGISRPQRYGGHSGSLVDLCLALDELAYASVSVAERISATNLTEIPLYLYGTQDLVEKYAVPMAKGEKIGSMCITEPAHGSDVASMETYARLDGDHWVVNGAKRYMDNAAISDTYVVFLKTDLDVRPKHKGISTIVIPRESPGFTAFSHDLLGGRGLDVGGFTMKDCRVPRENLIGEQGQGFYHVMKLFEYARPVVASLALGLARGAYDAAMEYAKSRIEFDQPISSFQLIQAKIADMTVDIEASHLLTYQSAFAMDRGTPSDRLAAVAKLFTSEAVVRVADHAVQIGGTDGYCKSHPMERFYRDARMFPIGEGTSEILRLLIARRELETKR
ncbi:MAG: acyl-CoA dehydrogenase [Chloroflexota bacterium]|nr:MAG: acyl-CoA dehydrogenase [Chloroflexota bacterium]